MNDDWIAKRLPVVIDRVKIDFYRDTHIQKLSKGFRQRVGIAQAILHEPEVLILDEPTIGIDPVQVVETRSLISELAGDHTLILSSHILPEVSAICKRVLVIHEGRIVADDEPRNLSDQLQHTERIQLAVRGADTTDVVGALRALSMVVDVRNDTSADARRIGAEGAASFVVDARPGLHAVEQVAKTVVARGWGLVNLHPLPLTLEEIFLQLTTREDLGN
jgi:ABC-2 type transport system ATP-binding protein